MAHPSLPPGPTLAERLRGERIGNARRLVEGYRPALAAPVEALARSLALAYLGHEHDGDAPGEYLDALVRALADFLLTGGSVRDAAECCYSDYSLEAWRDRDFQGPGA